MECCNINIINLGCFSCSDPIDLPISVDASNAGEWVFTFEFRGAIETIAQDFAAGETINLNALIDRDFAATYQHTVTATDPNGNMQKYCFTMKLNLL